jgi:hypothetical protein
MWLGTDEVLAASHEAAAGDLNEGRVQIVRQERAQGRLLPRRCWESCHADGGGEDEGEDEVRKI